MPTLGRASFVAQSIKYFQSQDYPNKELIIVDESLDTAMLHMHRRGDIRYITIAADMRLPLGAKRNLACALSQGELITHWDDDDYYGPHRLTCQAEPILADRADASAFRMSLLFDASKGELWECSDAVHASLFAHNVRSSTLMYRASYYRTGWNYPNVALGEDVPFLDGLLARGARLEQVTSAIDYICVRHGGNMSADIEGMELAGWHNLTKEPYFSLDQYFSDEEIAFYATLKGAP